MSVKEFTECSEVDQYMVALVTNCGAIRAITEAVEGTIGPKGLDCMLVDPFGGILVTNDGVTILKTMDVTHPAARILISAAEYQEQQVGDGTTTATIIAGTLVAEGVNQVLKGVPVVRVIEGIRVGIDRALKFLAETKIPAGDLSSPILYKIAFVAAREHRDLADIVMKAARIAGVDRLGSDEYKLADQVVALEGSESTVVQGTIINRMPLNRQMPRRVHQTKILIVDDALEPIKIDTEALTTETGFNHQLHKERELLDGIQKIADLGVGAVFVDRFICDCAEDLLTDLGIIGVQGVCGDEWRRLAEMTGARPVKRGSLSKPPEELATLTGEVDQLLVDDKFHQIRILGKPTQNFVTIIAGAHTKEVVCERERIMKDAASAVQAAWRDGAVPGGGSVEMSIVRKMNERPLRDMACYGYYCVIEALKKPLIQICINAGFNPLEKVAEVLSRAEQSNSDAIGVNCDTGAIEDVTQSGIWDPYLVKYQAIKTAGEVGEAILRIHMIIKMKEEKGHHDEKT